MFSDWNSVLFCSVPLHTFPKKLTVYAQSYTCIRLKKDNTSEITWTCVNVMIIIMPITAVHIINQSKALERERERIHCTFVSVYGSHLEE